MEDLMEKLLLLSKKFPLIDADLLRSFVSSILQQGRRTAGVAIASSALRPVERSTLYSSFLGAVMSTTVYNGRRGADAVSRSNRGGRYIIVNNALTKCSLLPIIFSLGLTASPIRPEI